jgi:hypothetical protein
MLVTLKLVFGVANKTPCGFRGSGKRMKKCGSILS